MTRHSIRISIVSLCVLALAQTVWPQSSGSIATQPSPTATTLPTTRYTLIMPDGMQVVTAAGRKAICPPEISAAVTKAIIAVPPATRPTTMPSDLLATLDKLHQTFLDQLTGDLSLPQDKVSEFLDKTWKHALEEWANVHPDVYTIVCTQAQLTAVVRAGWHAPLFHYNVLAAQTMYTPRVTVPIGGQMDDVVMWAEIQPKASDDDIALAVNKTVGDYERLFPQSESRNAMLRSQDLLIRFMYDNSIAPMKLPESQSWFGMGVMGAMSAKYTSELVGVPRSTLAVALSSDNPNNPVRSAPLDLLHGIDPSIIRPEYLAPFRDAISRKAAGALQKVLNHSGDSVLPKIFAAIKASPPATNLDLVKMIKDISGVDISSDLAPQ